MSSSTALDVAFGPSADHGDSSDEDDKRPVPLPSAHEVSVASLLGTDKKRSGPRNVRPPKRGKGVLGCAHVSGSAPLSDPSSPVDLDAATPAEDSEDRENDRVSVESSDCPNCAHTQAALDAVSRENTILRALVTLDTRVSHLESASATADSSWRSTPATAALLTDVEARVARRTMAASSPRASRSRQLSPAASRANAIGPHVQRPSSEGLSDD